MYIDSLRGAVHYVVRSSWAANTSAARRGVAIGYGAWKLARTTAQEDRTTIARTTAQEDRTTIARTTAQEDRTTIARTAGQETHTTIGPAPRPATGKERTAILAALWMGFKEICSKPIALAVDLLSSRAKLPQYILGHR